MKLGAMQDWPLRVMRLVDHAEREHGNREIVSAWGDGSITRSSWREVAAQARRIRRRLLQHGCQVGDVGLVVQEEAIGEPPQALHVGAGHLHRGDDAGHVGLVHAL